MFSSISTDIQFLFYCCLPSNWANMKIANCILLSCCLAATCLIKFNLLFFIAVQTKLKYPLSEYFLGLGSISNQTLKRLLPENLKLQNYLVLSWGQLTGQILCIQFEALVPQLKFHLLSQQLETYPLAQQKLSLNLRLTELNRPWRQSPNIYVQNIPESAVYSFPFIRCERK